MGTNFYWIEEGTPCHACGVPAILANREGDHIGKRSAAGLYCWDCDLTLCPEGKERIHYGRGEEWPDRCSRCGKGPPDDVGLASWLGEPELHPRGVAGRGHGERPTGVASTSSFSWALEPDEVRARCEVGLDRELIVDEYGRVHTGREFLAMFRAQCAIEFMCVGRHFS